MTLCEVEVHGVPYVPDLGSCRVGPSDPLPLPGRTGTIEMWARLGEPRLGTGLSNNVALVRRKSKGVIGWPSDESETWVPDDRKERVLQCRVYGQQMHVVRGENRAGERQPVRWSAQMVR